MFHDSVSLWEGEDDEHPCGDLLHQASLPCECDCKDCKEYSMMYEESVNVNDNRPHHDTQREMNNYAAAVKGNYDMWVARAMGTEQPVRYRSGWYLPVMNFATGQEGLYCYADDIVYTGKDYWALVREGHQYGSSR